MKPIPRDTRRIVRRHIRSALSLSLLAVALSLPATAAVGDAPPKKRVSAVRKIPRTLNAEANQSVVQNVDQPSQQVFQTLIAEFALQRGNADLASKAYSDLALRTRDPKILERAIEVAGLAQRLDLALETARLWVDVEPESLRAQQVLVRVMIMANKLDDLAPHLIRLLENDKEALGASLLGLNRMFARNPDRQAIFVLIEKVCQPFAGLAEAHYAIAMAASSSSDYVRALADVSQALTLRPDWEMAALLEAQILSSTTPTQVIGFLQGFVERNPRAYDIKMVLARALAGEKRDAEAKRHFDELLLALPDKPEVVYTVALYALQRNDLVSAESLFKRLLTLDLPDKSLAHFHLGQIAEDGKRYDEALASYARIGAGDQYLSAQMRSARLLADQGKLDQARQLLNDATVNSPEQSIQLAIAEAGLLREAGQPLAAFNLLDGLLAAQPDQDDLLYETALLAEKLGMINILDARLRKMIDLHPDSARAYNALGYSYADRNLRLPEANALISKALKLTPDDAFILDSMGWVLYRQGDLPGALSYLEQAYGKRDDPEVAAHLGEVLWTMDRKADAQRILRESQKKYPANEAVVDALKKFAP